MPVIQPVSWSLHTALGPASAHRTSGASRPPEVTQVQGQHPWTLLLKAALDPASSVSSQCYTKEKKKPANPSRREISSKASKGDSHSPENPFSQLSSMIRSGSVAISRNTSHVAGKSRHGQTWGANGIVKMDLPSVCETRADTVLTWVMHRTEPLAVHGRVTGA